MSRTSALRFPRFERKTASGGRLGRWFAFALWLLTLSATAESPDLDLLVLDTREFPGARADVAALLLSGADRGSLEASALAVPSAAGSGTGIDFWLELEGASLLTALEASEEATPRLELYAYAMTRDGDLAGHLSRRVRFPMDGLRDALGAGRVMLTGRLPTDPLEVQLHLLAREARSGRFVLRILQLDTAAEPPVDVPVPSALWPDAGEAWIVLNAPIASRAPASGPVETATETARPLELESQKGSRRLETIAGRYLAVLERLASGDTDAAVDQLLELERDVLATRKNASADPSTGRERSRALGWLEAAEERVIEQLASQDVESLLSLLVLHVAAHDRYLEMTGVDPMLPGATRQRILILARTYAAAAKDKLGRTLAASALAELGIAADRAGLPMASARLLEEALTLDDRHDAALLYLAYWHERRGDYEDAVPLLQRLLETAPRSHQGRLRLASVLRRMNELGEAVVHLRQLIRDAPPDWLLAIAYQELGRLLLAEERFEEAVSTLEAGSSRLPEQQRLHLQLAYTLERAGERQRSREVIDRLPKDDGQLSPRNLYSRRPQTDDARARVALERHATARLPLLSQALHELGASK